MDRILSVKKATVRSANERTDVMDEVTRRELDSGRRGGKSWDTAEINRKKTSVREVLRRINAVLQEENDELEQENRELQQENREVKEDNCRLWEQNHELRRSMGLK
ncbi:Hypothetical protein DEACI_2654 [Acididesulfobacillus acetoxydans]|uniref:Uncharacterized protein n=1 Tax=Acididesulfobacillus acetoxydans TaxID=1561005 RepID=A0A8S0VXJ7_9FIRM|nr:hypothetical protein [Acididesulfobacillus acetoxydans]CAA7601983.1 Hypothetical protein DEACI_2654 [Acididesulfobacillus acetoxydans]CEJ08173.1 Hypothetical protein DEACI_2648 [Acididesulfobacillus acetoxydans]